jgi:hypothetical protein
VPSQEDTFVVTAAPWRVLLLGVVMIVCSAAFVAVGTILAAVPTDSLALRIVLVCLGLMVIGLAAYFVLLIHWMRNRIEVGPRAVKLRMAPTRGPLPLPRSIRAEIPYSEIAAVETREEVYSTFGLATVQRVYSMVTRDGTRFPLGLMTENWGAQLPFDQAAARIAERAHLPVVDRGAVRVGGIVRATLRDVPPWTAAPMTPAETAAWRRRAAIAVQIIGVIVIIGAMLRACGHS